MKYYFTALFGFIIMLIYLFASNLNRDARIDKIFDDIHAERVLQGLSNYPNSPLDSFGAVGYCAYYWLTYGVIT